MKTSIQNKGKEEKDEFVLRCDKFLLFHYNCYVILDYASLVDSKRIHYFL